MNLPLLVAAMIASKSSLVADSAHKNIEINNIATLDCLKLVLRFYTIRKNTPVLDTKSEHYL